MNKIITFVGALLLLTVGVAWQAGAAEFEEAKVIKGSSITLKFRDVPDGEVINGEYVVDANDGTIKLPYLPNRVYVAGKTARQVEDLVYKLYTDSEIYAHPIVTANVGESGINEGLKNRYVQVTGYVGSKKNLQYRPGMTLVEAILDCGDLSDYGTRYIQVTRNGQTRTYDYFSTKDRAIKLRSGDVIFVPKRGILEGRPDKLVP